VIEEVPDEGNSRLAGFVSHWRKELIMTTKPPPVPPDNRVRKGSGNQKRQIHQARKGPKLAKLDKQGQSANTKQNTRHQGYQQDR
jgi:hypothetical protein